MKAFIELAERGILPDAIIRWGIRRLNLMRLRQERRGGVEHQHRTLQELINQMKQSPIALATDKANQQHYEVPPEFFAYVLGKHRKYSACLWKPGVLDLDRAEADMLDLYSQRAQLADGQRILELGCGWGSFSLWAAATYPKSRITAVSNSAPQRAFIEKETARRGLTNVEVITADMNIFDITGPFDRVISIEMFEHMRNWAALLKRIRTWLQPDGRLFVHIFSHKDLAYPFYTQGSTNWLGRYFFTGGMMPSDNLMLYFQEDLKIEAHWRLNGRHYQKTAESWLAHMHRHRNAIVSVFSHEYGESQALRWYHRWRIFFMACAELWGLQKGQEWLISHYRLGVR